MDTINCLMPLDRKRIFGQTKNSFGAKKKLGLQAQLRARQAATKCIHAGAYTVVSTCPPPPSMKLKAATEDRGGADPALSTTRLFTTLNILYAKR